MDIPSNSVSSDAAIRALLDEWVEAHRVKDADRLMARFAPHPIQYILAPPLQYDSANAWGREEVEKWFATFDGPIECHIRDLSIAADEHVAFCHFLNQLGATSVAEGPFTMWHRVTLGLGKYDGAWLITHVHESVPFYMDGSFKAATDLEP